MIITFSLFGVVDGKTIEKLTTNSLNYTHSSDEIVVPEFTTIAPLLILSEPLIRQGKPIRKK